MRPILLDEGLPEQVAAALRCLGLDVQAVGDPAAPPKESEDDVNVEWCKARQAVLVTNDRGRKERIILRLLSQHQVDAIFVYKDLRAAPPQALARALLIAEKRMDDLAGGRKRIHHRLTPSGKLDPR